jgi:hypothetical protein
MVKRFEEVNPYTGRPIGEDAPANATGPSVAGTGDDSSVVVVRKKKKKKKNLFDGRTKLGRKFIERILKQRESRKLTKEETDESRYVQALPPKEAIVARIAQLMKRKNPDPLQARIEVGNFIELKAPALFKYYRALQKKGIKKGPEVKKFDKQLLQALEKKYGKDSSKGVAKALKEELDEKVKQPRQLINPSKEVMVVKNNKVIVVDKKDLKKYTSKGWSLAENVELEEALKPKDKSVVNAFYDGKSMKGDTLSTDGKKLEKSGLGAQTIAKVVYTSRGMKYKIVAKMDSRHTQSVVKYIKKHFPKDVLELNEQPEHEITVGNYTTSHFYMCGSAQELMKKHADKPGVEELTRLQDDYYKLEKVVMDAGEATTEQVNQAKDLYNRIMEQASELGLADDMTGYMKQHLDSIVKGDPKPGFGRTDESFEIDEGLMSLGLFANNPREINKAGFELTKFMKRRPPANVNGMKKFSDFVQKYIAEDRMGDTLDMMAGRLDDTSNFDHKMFLKLDPRGVVLNTLIQYERNLGAMLLARTLIDYGVQVVQINMDKASQGMYSVNVGRASRKSVQSGIEGVYGTMAYKGIDFAPKKEEKERNFTKGLLESLKDFGNEHELIENNLKVLQNIVKNKQMQKVKFKDKQANVDLFTASAIMAIHKKVRPDNKKKMEKLMNGKLADFMKLQSFAMKQIK